MCLKYERRRDRGVNTRVDLVDRTTIHESSNWNAIEWHKLKNCVVTHDGAFTQGIMRFLRPMRSSSNSTITHSGSSKHYNEASMRLSRTRGMGPDMHGAAWVGDKLDAASARSLTAWGSESTLVDSTGKANSVQCTSPEDRLAHHHPGKPLARWRRLVLESLVLWTMRESHERTNREV